jgi:diguanylate cyclase
MHDLSSYELELSALTATANSDSLTGLYNRRGLEHAYSRMSKTNSGSVLVIIDLDDFKVINDCLGHIIGDKALCHLGEVLRQSVRTDDLMSRIGGDEFMLILPATTIEEGRRLCDLIMARLAHPNQNPNPTFTFSAGLTHLGANESLASAFARADSALRRAKSSGKAQYHTEIK